MESQLLAVQWLILNESAVVVDVLFSAFCLPLCVFDCEKLYSLLCEIYTCALNLHPQKIITKLCFKTEQLIGNELDLLST